MENKELQVVELEVAEEMLSDFMEGFLKGIGLVAAAAGCVGGGIAIGTAIAAVT